VKPVVSSRPVMPRKRSAATRRNAHAALGEGTAKNRTVGMSGQQPPARDNWRAAMTVRLDPKMPAP